MQLKEAIDWLKNNDPATLGINRKEHSDGRVIYNYDQIASHSNRFNPVVRWCRSLVLDRDFNLVCRGFYRFSIMANVRKIATLLIGIHLLRRPKRMGRTSRPIVTTTSFVSI